jgi:hypothetical protein
MGQKRIVSPDTPIRSFPTPNIDDLVVILDVDSRLPGYKPLDYGTLHPDQTRFPGAKLVYQEPLDNSDQFVRRIYTTDRADQDAYNYAIKYSAGSPKHPIYIRTYVELRESYSPLADGTPDPLFPDAFLVEEEMAQVEGELNSLYVKVSRVFETLPGPVLTGFETNEAGQKVTVTTQRKSSNNYTLPSASATSSPSAQAEDAGVVTEQIRTVPSIFTRKQFSAERPDMLPQKFRAAVPDVETSELVLGTAEQPTLLQGDISASQTQQSLFVKQIARRSRTAPTYPVTIVETTATRSGQLATVTSTLDVGSQTADTGPLIESSEVTDLGDGRSIKVTTEVDEVFDQPSFTRSKEDLTPQKFRATVAETVEERTVSGAAEMPASLSGDQISKTEEQLTTDRKRVRTQERAIGTTNTLSELVVTSEGQLATRTLTLSNQQQTVTPSATLKQGEVEQLGDGRTVKTVITVPSVFQNKSVELVKPDVTPEKFRAALPSTATEQSEAGTVSSSLSLSTNELSKAETQQTEFIKRTRVVTRNPAGQATLASGAQYTDALGGGLANVTERFGDSSFTSLTPGYGTVAFEKEELGDGRFVSKHVFLGSPPELSGQVYDEQFDIVIPFTTQAVPTDTNLLGTARVNVQPDNSLHSTARILDVEAYREAVMDEHYQVAAYISVDLPDRLLEVTAVSVKASSGGAATSTGSSWSVSAEGTNANTIDMRWRIKNGYSGPVPAVRHIFFLDKNSVTFEAVLAKTGAVKFPALFPEAVVITAVGGSVSQRVQSSSSVDYSDGDTSTGTGTSYSTALNSTITTIPPTLHSSLSIGTQTITISPNNPDPGGTLNTSVPAFNGAFSPQSIPATSPPSFPPGDYLISVDTESWRYGLVRVMALVAKITSEYVS